MNAPACGHLVKITVKNSGHRRKFAIQYTGRKCSDGG